MSTSVHSVVILPGSKMNLFCQDGLNPLEVQNIKKIFNFGGSIKATNCGAANEWVALEQAIVDMKERKKEIPAGRARLDAMIANAENYKKMDVFQKSDVYQKYAAGRNRDEMSKVLFNRWTEHECGFIWNSDHYFNGYMNKTQKEFKELMCPPTTRYVE